MLRMLFQIGGDASPLNAELGKQADKARGHGERAGDSFGKHFGAKFRSMFLGLVSGATIVQSVKGMMDDAVRISADAAREGVGVEAFQELKRLSEEIGMDIKEIREVAPYAAKEFADAMATIQQNGGIIKAEDVQNLKAASDALKKLSAEMAPGISWLVTAFREMTRSVAGFWDWSLWHLNQVPIVGDKDAARFHKAAFDVYRTDPTAWEEAEASVGIQTAGMKFARKSKAAREWELARQSMSEIAGYELTRDEAIGAWVGQGGADRGVKPGAFDQQMLRELQAIRKSLE